MYKKFIKFVRELYSIESEKIPLHEPRFNGNEKKYIIDCIDTTFVSSVGEYVNKFEEITANFTGSKYAIAVVNGTAALHLSLIISRIHEGCEVITQPLTFIATVNAIIYMGADPIFIDVDKDTLGLSPNKLESFLEQNTTIKTDGFCYNIHTGKKIAACLPMHTFGFPGRIDEVKDICQRYNIILIEDAAESMGSLYKNKHTGTFGSIGVVSFNGNKIITTGGGGMVLTNNEELANIARHITTQAKMPHPWEYSHDMIGYNFRLPNLNAALGCAQMEQLPEFIENKRNLALKYSEYFNDTNIHFFSELEGSKANYWLNVILLKNKKERDLFLEITNNNGVMTRPAWQLMNKLKMFKRFEASNLNNAEWLYDRIVNIPSSVIK